MPKDRNSAGEFKQGYLRTNFAGRDKAHEQRPGRV